MSSPAPSQSRASLADAAVDTLLGYRHVRETRGYNRSPEIDRFCRLAGVPLGSSWCEAAQFAGFELAARAIGVDNPLMRTGSVARQLAYAKMIGSGLEVIPISKVIGSSQLRLRRGDCLMAKHGAASDRDIGRLWLGHAGTAIEQRGSRVVTIEGNTSSGRRGSQRDGDGMFVRERPLSFWLAAVRVARARIVLVWPVRLRVVQPHFA